jgi:hypothetical protein
MRVSVRCGVARPAQLRGAARSVLLLQRVAPASRGSQRFGRCARLDQGCAARLVVAAEGEPEPAALHSAAEGEAEPQKRRRKRAPNVGERGETTADGKPEPDERTVEDLVRRGWFESEEDAEALLTRKKSQHQRFPYETAQPAADWLETMLGLVQLKGGLLPAAKAVKACPQLLCQDAATLQRNWDALTLPAEQGGAGIAFSQEQAREAVLKHPSILGYTTNKLKRGWLMLTAAEGGLGLSPEEARSCILLNPAVLRFNHDAVVRRVELLRSLGYPKAHRMVLRQSRVLSFTEETVREHAAWWKQTGLDHVKIVTMNPTLLGVVSVDELQAKLDFLSVVVGMSTAELNNAPSLFGLSLDDRLRARYFYALQEGRLARFGSINTMMSETDTSFLAMLEGQPSRGRATDLEVARYKEQVASPEFVAWRERQEALLVRDAQLRSAKALARIRQDVCALHP